MHWLHFCLRNTYSVACFSPGWFYINAINSPNGTARRHSKRHAPRWTGNVPCQVLGLYLIDIKKLESWGDWLFKEVNIWVGNYIKNWTEGQQWREKWNVCKIEGENCLNQAGKGGAPRWLQQGQLRETLQRWQRRPCMGLCVPDVSLINMQSRPKNPTSALAGERPPVEGSC